MHISVATQPKTRLAFRVSTTPTQITGEDIPITSEGTKYLENGPIQLELTQSTSEASTTKLRRKPPFITQRKHDKIDPSQESKTRS